MAAGSSHRSHDGIPPCMMHDGTCPRAKSKKCWLLPLAGRAQVCYNSSGAQLVKAAPKAPPAPLPSQCGACGAANTGGEGASLRPNAPGLPLAAAHGTASISCGACSAAVTLMATAVREWDW